MTLWVYIVKNPKGRFYIGHTADLGVRICNHNRKDKISGKFTRKNGPWKLVWCEEHPNRGSAMRRERQIKSWKSAKFIRRRLINPAATAAQRLASTQSGFTD